MTNEQLLEEIKKLREEIGMLRKEIRDYFRETDNNNEFINAGDNGVDKVFDDVVYGSSQMGANEPTGIVLSGIPKVTINSVENEINSLAEPKEEKTEVSISSENAYEPINMEEKVSPSEVESFETMKETSEAPKMNFEQGYIFDYSRADGSNSKRISGIKKDGIEISGHKDIKDNGKKIIAGVLVAPSKIDEALLLKYNLGEEKNRTVSSEFDNNNSIGISAEYDSSLEQQNADSLDKENNDLNDLYNSNYVSPDGTQHMSATNEEEKKQFEDSGWEVGPYTKKSNQFEGLTDYYGVNIR